MAIRKYFLIHHVNPDNAAVTEYRINTLGEVDDARLAARNQHEADTTELRPLSEFENVAMLDWQNE
jgi:hypothetical protein